MLYIFMLPIPYRGCFKGPYFTDNLVRFNFYSCSVGRPGMVAAMSSVFLDECSTLGFIICDVVRHDERNDK